MKYRHLSLEERHYIGMGLRNGESLNAIAKLLGRSQTTIGSVKTELRWRLLRISAPIFVQLSGCFKPN